ncbi:MAG: GNAT family N-acetyltransferase [Polyangiaceae bacterium]
MNPEVTIAIELFGGLRSELLPLFRQADDSSIQISSYLELGEVLVAWCEHQLVGQVQLVRMAGVLNRPGEVVGASADWELKSLAVSEAWRARGIGSALLCAALDRAFDAGADRVVVATATADIDNLRFYQRHGLRMDRVERDVFTVECGYPSALECDGIPVRDRIWFSLRRDERERMRRARRV